MKETFLPVEKIVEALKQFQFSLPGYPEEVYPKIVVTGKRCRVIIGDPKLPPPGSFCYCRWVLHDMIKLIVPCVKEGGKEIQFFAFDPVEEKWVAISPGYFRGGEVTVVCE
jgi:hypothetical protein